MQTVCILKDVFALKLNQIFTSAFLIARLNAYKNIMIAVKTGLYILNV
jgi:hypothetical protein